MTNHIAKVQDFVAAWNAKNKNAILSAFAQEAVYHNIPMAPAVGLAQITETIERLIADMSDVQWDILAIAETADGKVLTERVDAFVMHGKKISLPVMGIFEFHNGLIARWADYFDLDSYRQQLSA